MSDSSPQPMQPIRKDSEGHFRFRENSIVRHLLDHGGISLNDLAILNFPQEDREQFAQLIGYSVSGFSELSYVRDETYEAAVLQTQADVSESEARLAVLEKMLEDTREHVRKLVSVVFQNHPDDLVP